MQQSVSQALSGRHCSWESTHAKGAWADTSWSQAPSGGSQAIDSRLGFRCPRRTPDQRPPRHHCDGTARTQPAVPPFGTPCPKGCKTDSSVLP